MKDQGRIVIVNRDIVTAQSRHMSTDRQSQEGEDLLTLLRLHHEREKDTGDITVVAGNTLMP